MPSIRLWENLQKVRKLWWCKNLNIFRIDTNGRLEENEWSVTQVIGSEARRSCTWSKKPYVAMNIKYFSRKEQRTKEFVKSHMHSELPSHIASYRRTLHDPEVERERSTQNLEQQEAQLRVQLQAEEAHDGANKGMFTNKLQKVRGKLLSANKSWRLLFEAKCRRNSTACASWKKKRGNETYHGCGGAKHEGDSRRKLFALLICSSSTTRNVSYATFLRQQKQLILHCRHRDLLKVTHGNTFHRLLMLYRTRGQLPIKVLQPSKEGEKFKFEPWPQASKFNSWKMSFRREVVSGSTHPRLMVDWFAELDVAARMEEPDPSGFVFDKHQPVWGKLKLRIQRLLHGIMKIILAEFKRKIHLLEETQSKNKFPMLTVRQIHVSNIFFFQHQ